MSMTAQWACLTHVGAVREQNQDAVVGQPPIFAVADGMGGHAAGDIASQIAVRHLGAFTGSAAVDMESTLAACRAANAEILFRSRSEPELAGMGTTVAGVALSRTTQGDAALVFNVGDSRVYLATEAGLVQISTDHSLVAELVAAEEITEAEARVHPQRNVVTRGLGLEDDVTIDTWVLQASDVHRRFLICSDGLTNEIDDEQLSSLLLKDCSPTQCAEDLLALALERGARDNVSVVVLDLEPRNGEPGWVDGDTLPREMLPPRTLPPPEPVPATETASLISAVPTFAHDRLPHDPVP